MLYELLTGSYFSSVGASGAVFGVEGALLFLVIWHHGKLESLNAGRVAFSIAFSLYCGFTSTYVNNAAHVGGVLMGFAAAAVISLLSSHIGRRKDRDTYEN
jgi:rhomboid protease GluP